MVLNPSFEVVGAPCSTPIPPNITLNAAFNDGCVPAWYAANGTPSICTGPNGNPPDGNQVACLGSNHEGIFQNLDVCQVPGQELRIEFSHRAPRSNNAPFFVYLASGLFNVPNSSPGTPLTIGQNWQLVGTFIANQTWQDVAVTITINNSNNNQLLFLASDVADVFIDRVSVVCISQLQPSIASTYLGAGSFTFTGSISSHPLLNATNWCWEFGDGTFTNGPNLTQVTHTYNQPGQYQVCLRITDNCCACMRDTCITIIFDPCRCSDIPTVLDIGGPVTWSQDQLRQSDVIIAPGTHLLIDNATIRMLSPCKFVVMRGASLRLQRARITSECSQTRWGGIVVWGNSAILHGGNVFNLDNPINNPLNAPGVFRSILSSELERMNATGVHAQRLSVDNPANENVYANYGHAYGPGVTPASYTGGVVRCFTTTFSDNIRCADFRDYPHTNYSLFSGCAFTNPGGNQPTNNGRIGIRIWNTDGISISDCYFNQVGSAGIVTIDGAIGINRSIFFRNYRGVSASSAAGQTGFVQIGNGSNNARNLFERNWFGIWSDGIYNLNVYNNQFTQNGEPIKGSIWGPAGGGIVVTGPSSFDIYDNDFLNNTRGIELLNTGGQSGLGPNQRIKCNIHQQDRTAIWVRGRCSGMYFRDNAYGTILRDLLIQPHLGINAQPGEIHYFQGLFNNGVYNIFSAHGKNIISSLQPGQTVFFEYYAPIIELPPMNSPLIPDCDIGGFEPPNPGVPCPENNNFIINLAIGHMDPCLEGHPNAEFESCIERSCLDSLRTRLLELEDLVAQDEAQYRGEWLRTRLRFDTDLRALSRHLAESGQIEDALEMLRDYGDKQALLLLYALQLRIRDYEGAISTLDTLEVIDEEAFLFGQVQRIHLSFLTGGGAFIPSTEQDSLLEEVAMRADAAGSAARAIYHLLYQGWLEPYSEAQLDDFTEPAERYSQKFNVSKHATEALLQVYPNPARHEIHVQTASAEGYIRILNPGGVILKQEIVQSEMTSIDINLFTSGFYIVQYVSVEGQILSSGKFVINR